MHFDWAAQSGVISILEFGCHKLLVAHGFTLVTLSCRGWEAFSTPGALSPMTPQVPDVTPGSPFVPIVLQALLMERCVTNELTDFFYCCGCNIVHGD